MQRLKRVHDTQTWTPSGTQIYTSEKQGRYCLGEVAENNKILQKRLPLV
jgi:hypothetical protein